MGKQVVTDHVRKQNEGSLGRALYKSRFAKPSAGLDFTNASGGTDRWLHNSELDDTSDWNKIKGLKSLTEQNSLDEFLTNAELANTNFEAERLNLNFVNKFSNDTLSTDRLKKIKEIQNENKELLKIPRRPLWKNSEYDARTLELKERESFLSWRRNLAISLEKNNLPITPFEKNLEFWRQLWRVIEKSDVVVQLVDARNPLLFYCEDLEEYVKEIDPNKENLLLINKSDFLSLRQRFMWLKYFEKRNVKVIFWSAVTALQINENEAIKNDIETAEGCHESDESETSEEDYLDKKLNKFCLLNDEKSNNGDDSGTDDDEDDNDSSTTFQFNDQNKNETQENDSSIENNKIDLQNSDPHVDIQNSKNDLPEEPKLIDKAKIETTIPDIEMTEKDRDSCKIVNKEELIAIFKTIHKDLSLKENAKYTTIGLVGYPNVGKSSTLNAILQNKKVAVSETPGRTKHYQTFFYDNDLMICDCPGLVFPSFVSTRGELITNGILPIDQMRDYIEPINIIINQIPQNVFEMIYGIEIKKSKNIELTERLCTAEELCSAYSTFRGYMNHKGMPDVNRGARYILKDFVNGKLLYCYPPPEIDHVSFQDHRYEVSKEIKYLERINKKEKLKNKNTLTNFDREFFSKLEPRALSKGGIVGYHRKNAAVKYGTNIVVDKSDATESSSKKHFKANRKGKLRCKTTQFETDQNNYL